MAEDGPQIGPFSYADKASWADVSPSDILKKAYVVLSSSSIGVVGMRHLRSAISQVGSVEKSITPVNTNPGVFIYAYVVQQLLRNFGDQKRIAIAKNLIAAAADKNDYLFGFLFPEVYHRIAGLHGVVALSGIDEKRGTRHVLFDTTSKKRELGACLSLIIPAKKAGLPEALKYTSGYAPLSDLLIDGFDDCKDVFLGYITSDIGSVEFDKTVTAVDKICDPEAVWFVPDDFKKHDLNLYRRVVVPENEACARILMKHTAGGVLEPSPQDKARMDRDIWNKRAMEMVCTRLEIIYK